MTAEYNHNDSDFVETLIKRKITEKCSLQQLLKGLTKQEEAEEYDEGEIEISYKTHKKNKKILSGEITIKLFHYGEIYQKSYLHFKN